MSNFFIKKAVLPEEIKTFADMALKFRLYVSGWMLSEWLINARARPEDVKAICLTFNEDRPDVPIAVLLAFKERTSAIFVKKFYRKLGLGTRLVQDITKEEDFIPIFKGHDARSVAFFEKQDLKKIKLEYWYD